MVLDTVHKQKSFAITLVIMAIIFLILFLMKMTTSVLLPQEEEGGIAITFGTDAKGRGEINPPKPTQQEAAAPEVPAQQEPQPTTPQPSEQLITQDTEEETVVIPKPEVQKPKKENPKTEKPAKKPERKPATSTTDALASVMNASARSPRSGSGDGNQGDDAVAGYKGDPKGDPYANSFYGGSGNAGKGWGLSGRKNISGQQIKQDCNEAGFVVVQIEVDRTGKVIRAKAGEKGTTNKAQCLLEAARKTALTYRFNEDDKAPQTQIGFIAINFGLGE